MDKGALRLAFSVGSEPTPSAGPSRARLARTIAGAVAAGLPALDLSDSPTPEAAWTLAREGAGPRWSALGIFVTERPAELTGRALPGQLIVLESPSERRSGQMPGGPGVRFGELGAAEAGAHSAVRGGAAWVALPGSLLDAPRLIELVAELRAAGAAVLLTNPHADGRLDGQWLTEGLSPTSRSPRPVDFAELERSYAPVLALAFLTERRGRTLPQAAVAFAVAIGAVPSVRFRDLAQVEAFGTPDRLEPLTEAELARLARG